MTEFTNETYRAHQPPEVLALMDLSLLDPNRASVGGTLASKGFLIDWPIMVWGWDAVKVMSYRQLLGLTWASSATMAGGGGSGAVPKGAIKVSLDSDDYPPFIPPADPVAVAHEEVDAIKLNGIYKATNFVYNPDGSLKHSEGFTEQHHGETVYFHIGWNIMGRIPMWLDQTAWDRFRQTGSV